MLIYADIRPLQDPLYARRGIGSHAASLLAAARRWSAGRARIVGLSDPELGVLPDDYARLCDTILPAFTAGGSSAPAVFLSLSPLTHDSRLPARLLDRPEILSCAVVHDFIPLEFPQHYLGRRETLLSYAAAMEWLSAYRFYFPNSAGCAAELSRRLGKKSAEIAVTGVALRPVFAHLHAGQAAAPERPTAVAGDYFLFVGGPDWRKNLEGVVEAYGRLPSLQDGPALVIAGGYPEAWRRRVVRQAARISGGRARLHFLEHVADEELAAWYRHALATIAASRAEGFSIPVIEGMACRSPVLVSDIPVHRELVSDPGARFNVEDAGALTHLLDSVLRSPSLREQLITTQQDTPGRFTDEQVGKRFWEALDARFTIHAARLTRQPALRRPSIALVTPFPPDQSGVADYSLCTVEALARNAQIDVYTDQPQPHPTPAVRAFYPISAAAYLRPDYDAVVSVVGNSAIHTKIIELHSRYGGACILHDARLIDIYAWWKGVGQVRTMAEAELHRPVSDDEVDGWLKHPGTLETLFLSDVLAKSQPMFVHSSGLRDNIRQHYGVDAHHLPFSVQRTFAPVETTPEARRRARIAVGIPAGRTVLVTLGMLATVKAPDVCVEALAMLRRGGRDAHLYFVGATGRESETIQDLAERRGIAQAIHFTSEWLDEATYRRYLLAADCGIQLRTHQFGGLSGALIDCVSAGLPTVANHDLAAALDAPAYVARVSDRLDPGAVARAIEGWLEAGGEMGRDESARQAYSAEHSFDTYAAQLAARLFSPAGAGGVRLTA